MKAKLTTLFVLLMLAAVVYGETFTENFDGESFAPDGWTNGGVTRYAPGYDSSAYAIYFQETSGNTITTPFISMPTAISYYAKKISANTCKFEGYYATEADPTAWVPFFQDAGVTSSWGLRTPTIINTPGSKVKIRFSLSLDTHRGVYIDNIVVTFNGPVSFQTTGGGNWNTASIWQYSADGTNWYNATSPPDYNADAITVLSGNTVTVTANVTTDQTVVEGSLTINSGVTLTLNNGTGTDLTINGTLTNTGTLAFNTSATMTAGASSTIAYNGFSAQALGAGFPSAVTNLTIKNSSGVTLSGSCTVNGTFTLTEGIMAIGANTLYIYNTAIFGASSYVSGAGSFVMLSSATLQTANSNGIASVSSGALGSVQTTTRSYATGANYVYNGSSAQNTGTGLPATVTNLTINNSAGVTLAVSCQVDGVLGLTTGLSLRSTTLTINGTLSGSGGLTGGNNSNLTVTKSGIGIGGTITLPNVTTLKNLTINRLGVVILGGNCTVVGLLTLNTGLTIGANTLTINGTIPTVTGGIVGGASSSIIVGGTTALTLPAITSGLNNFTTNRSGGVTLGSAVSVGGTFTNSAILNVSSFGISGSGAGINNGTIVSAISSPVTTANFTQGAGSTIEYTANVTLPSGYTYQNLLLNSASTVFTLGGNITVNETFSTAIGASLNLSGYRMIFPSKYVSVGGSVSITAFIPETHDEQPAPGGIARKWTFTGAPAVSPTIYIHWDNDQDDSVNFSNGSTIWKYVSGWQEIGKAGNLDLDGANQFH